jgi:hypothetical protein
VDAWYEYTELLLKFFRTPIEPVPAAKQPPRPDLEPSILFLLARFSAYLRLNARLLAVDNPGFWSCFLLTGATHASSKGLFWALQSRKRTLRLLVCPLGLTLAR